MVVASALRLLVFVFRLGQTHRIDVMRAILVPRGSENNCLYFNKLRGIVGAIFQTECNRLQMSRTQAHFSRWEAGWPGERRPALHLFQTSNSGLPA